MISFGGKQTQLTQQVRQIFESLKFTSIQNISKDNQELIQKIKTPDYFKILIDIVSSNKSKQDSFSAFTLLNTYESRDRFFTSELFFYASSKIIQNPIHFQDHPLRKVYKSFIQKICSWHNIISWNPAQAFKINLQQEEKLKPALDCLLGIAGAFEYRLDDSFVEWLYNFDDIVLPTLVQKMIENCAKNPQILYLGFKYLQKVSLCILPKNILQAVTQLIDIIKVVINAKQIYPLDQYSQRNTNGFYFFHTKKWAYKLLTNIIKRSTFPIKLNKKSGIKSDLTENPKKWISDYGQDINVAMLNDLKAEYPPQVYIQMLKCIQKIQNHHSNILLKYKNLLQFEILIPMMVITAEEEEKMKNQPFHYNKDINDFLINHKNIKRTCEDIWVGFLKKPFLQNDQQILNFFYELIISKNPIQIELALRLMAKSPEDISAKVFENQSEMIMNFMQCEIFVLRAAAFSYISSFIRKSNVAQNTLIKLLELTYDCLTKDNYIYVRLKASEAMLKISKKEEVHSILKPIIYECCLICLKLSEEFWSDHLIVELENLFKVFYDQLTPLAPELFKHVERVFLELINSSKSINISEDYESLDNIQFTIETLLDFQKQLVQTMPNNKLEMIENTLVNYEQEFIKKGSNLQLQTLSFFQLLASFLNKCESISDRFWFYFDCFVQKPNVQKNFISPQPGSLMKKLVENALIEDCISCFSTFLMFLHKLPHNVYLQKLESLLIFVKSYKNYEFDDQRMIYLIWGCIFENVVWLSVQVRNQFVNEVVSLISKEKNKKLDVVYQYITTSLLAFNPQVLPQIYKKSQFVYKKMLYSLKVSKDKIIFPKLYVLACLNILLPHSIPIDLSTSQVVLNNVLKLMKIQNLDTALLEECSDSEGEKGICLDDSMQSQLEDDVYIFADFPLYHRSNRFDEKSQFIKTMGELKKNYSEYYYKNIKNGEVEEIVGKIKEKNPFIMEFNELSVQGANPE